MIKPKYIVFYNLAGIPGKSMPVMLATLQSPEGVWPRDAVYFYTGNGTNILRQNGRRRIKFSEPYLFEDFIHYFYDKHIIFKK